MSDAGRRPGADVAAYWDGKYRGGGALWGDAPSELAAIAVARLGELGPARPTALTLLDLGCGYGRDAVALWDALRTVGRGSRRGGARHRDGARRPPRRRRPSSTVWPTSATSRDSATSTAGEPEVAGEIGRPPAARQPDGSTSCTARTCIRCSIPAGRAALRATVGGRLAPGGLFFLSTLSTRDPRHAGRGRPVPGEPDSFVEQTYLHLCRRDELEPTSGSCASSGSTRSPIWSERPEGAPHDHVSWIVVGRAP